MSTVTQNIGLIELSVLSTAVTGGIGYLITRAVGRSERRAREDANQDTSLQLLQRDVTGLVTKVDRIERRQTVQGEELSAVGMLMERHERWHERHDPMPPGGTP
jgi:hypothetical protein